jgi:hypothetical protein
VKEKDRSHYGELKEEVVIEVTPERAGAWLSTRPPPPLMWSRGGANNEKAARYAAAMLAGEWDNDMTWDEGNNRPTEPVMINADHGYILGGHHRLTAVTKIGRPQALRVRFYTKPPGLDAKLREKRDSHKGERMAAKKKTSTCPICGAERDDVAAHIEAAHEEQA